MKANKAPVATGVDFVGMDVVVAFNLRRCGPKVRVQKAECFTVMSKPEGSSGSRRGKVMGYVDRILLGDVGFYVSSSGVNRIRRTKSREVIAWVYGTVLDPKDVKLGDMRSWYGFTFNPYRDDTFVLRESLKPIESAFMVYFDSASKKALARLGGYRPNQEAVTTVDTERQLRVLTEELGGDVSTW